MNIEDRLRTDMDRFTRDVYVPEGLALKAYKHSQKRRATVRVATASGAVTVLAAGAVAAAGAAGAFGSRAGVNPAAVNPTAVKPTRATAYVVARVESALAPAKIANLMGSIRTEYPPGVAIGPVPGGMSGGRQGSGAAFPQWSVGYTLGLGYGRSGRYEAYSPSGQHVFDLATRVVNGTVTSTAVIYANGTWWTGTSPVRVSGQTGCDEGQNVRLSPATGGWPGFIRSQLACGAYRVAGHQMVDGIDAVKLTTPVSGFTILVDPLTYLPVQVTAGPLHLYFQWLPATPANLAQLNEPVPSGFQQVSPPARP